MDMTRLIRHATPGSLILIAFTFAACGGDSSSPSGPSSTGVQSISVTATSPVKVGQTVQASSVATFSGGRTEAITTGWRSDTASVAAVTDGGLITGVANGNAVISVSSGGRTGQQTIRVVPDYDGQWTGNYRVTTCAESGVFADQGFCAFVLNTSAPVRFTVSQSGLATNTGFALGQLGFPAAVAPIDAAGLLTIPDAVFSESVTITARWTVQQATAGALTGAVHQRWELPNRTGEGVLDGEIVSVSRAAAAPVGLSLRSRPSPTLHDAMLGAGFGR
jgi:hypothetical protein